ncbi:bacteriocin [Lactococcus lactis]|uniref:Bacteriocin n=1 Tax=Lactococcus lactis TaxID=1358 RepID=A0A9X4NIB6_9LACT|nr:bacteriocin [Lactococcus lactis]MDG4983949.1 bacteriocin [Lactococcus lactis]
MKRDDIITLSDGQTATIVRGDESDFKNVYIVQLDNGQTRVIDRETLTLAKGVSDIRGRHSRR